MTAGEAAASGAAFLSGVSGTAALDAQVLLAWLLGTTRAALHAHPEQALDPALEERYQAVLHSRRAGVCVAYLTGYKEFRRLSLRVTPDVLVPRPDTETLVEAALEYVEAARGGGGALSVLDVCTGSGAVALALKDEAPDLHVHASDVSAAALAIARENARALALEVRFIHSDLFQHIDARYHIITANPPYVPAAQLPTLAPEVRREPRLALDGGADGLDVARSLIAGAPAHLEVGGALLLELSPPQMPAAASLLERAGFSGVRVFPGLDGNARVVGAVR
ncbi:MAG: peptide chain release factor N(5)-glutamine methyltransferase [Spirochaetaceae bacterium]|jgi:release factor glutamine methyltransferase|nr:peptide chain release factor N(5)-glutamine methyltransferase [Spirochaetaceae bacterium]